MFALSLVNTVTSALDWTQVSVNLCVCDRWPQWAALNLFINEWKFLEVSGVPWIIIRNDVIDLDVSRNTKFIFLVMMIGLVSSRKLGILINTAETDFKGTWGYNIRTCDVHLWIAWEVRPDESWFKSGGDIVSTKSIVQYFGVSYPPYFCDGSRLASPWFRLPGRLLEVNLPRVPAHFHRQRRTWICPAFQLIFIVKGELFFPFAWGFILHWILLKFSPVRPAYSV